MTGNLWCFFVCLLFIFLLLSFIYFSGRKQLQLKLSQAQDKVMTLQSGREQVFSKLGAWFK